MKHFLHFVDNSVLIFGYWLAFMISISTKAGGRTLSFFAEESLLKADKHVADVFDVSKLSDSVWDRFVS